jgi:hypothetical protein
VPSRHGPTVPTTAWDQSLGVVTTRIVNGIPGRGGGRSSRRGAVGAGVGMAGRCADPADGG